MPGSTTSQLPGRRASHAVRSRALGSNSKLALHQVKPDFTDWKGRNGSCIAKRELTKLAYMSYKGDATRLRDTSASEAECPCTRKECFTGVSSTSVAQRVGQERPIRMSEKSPTRVPIEGVPQKLLDKNILLFHARMSYTCLTLLSFGSRKTRCDLLVAIGRLPVSTGYQPYRHKCGTCFLLAVVSPHPR